MNDKTIGIVLKQTDYRENGALLHVLSKEYGKITFVAQGVRKMNSKNAAITMPFGVNTYLFDYHEDKTIFNLKTGNVVENNRHIQEDLVNVSIATVMGQIVEKTLMEGMDDPQLVENEYDLLHFCLNRLNENDSPYLVLSMFVARILDYIGLNPTVDQCVLCGSTEVSSISIAEGGFVCKNCQRTIHVVEADLDTLRKFRLINKADVINFNACKEYALFTLQDAKILIDFFETHTGMKIDSFAFLKSIG